MRMILISMLYGTMSVLVWSQCASAEEVKGEFASPKTDEEMIKNALYVVSDSIAKGATVIAIDANGKEPDITQRNEQLPPAFQTIPPTLQMTRTASMRTAWSGSWHGSTGPYPSERQGGLRLHAAGRYHSKQTWILSPPNPRRGMKRMQEPPHVMMFNDGGDAVQKDYPRPGEYGRHVPQPSVMWAEKASYQHLMLPVSTSP